ncbi:peptidoglycan editing factor PgeF [Kordiimonas marina]|uniref:peptidoglycan editing factor PgeF n=1 Tax=Kordiimonas marina TaxID=2872312 RepID=UPI001FF389B8|nr:peptidoglycan editing factor PgeF [Kordiimonas marina]MCJ9429704.1 peptidoglycan editing factor PgeF [Kordiimonas marina]
MTHIKSPDIHAPHAFLSRIGGVSDGVYESLNCGAGSDDVPAHVQENRRIAAGLISGTPDTPVLSCYQVHGAGAIHVTEDWGNDRPKADAMVTDRPGLILGILTADCTPVLFEDAEAGIVGAAHAGWKGAFGGVTDSTVALMEDLGADRSRIHAAIGPTIAQASYEVDAGFRETFLKSDESFDRFFIPGKDATHFQFDLPAFVRHRLADAGITHIWDAGLDTYASADHFSYRRTTHRHEPDYGRQLSGIMVRP